MTKAEKYNKKLHEICDPEIERLQRRENVSEKILNKLNEKTNIDYCGLEKWQLINLIGKEIDELVV
ncbi:MAG: hypothetical protein ACOC5T_03460 [Elusimicrobiota bacterium]